MSRINQAFFLLSKLYAVSVIVDLKTCNDLDSFEYDARKYMYGIQFAFYQQIFVSAIIDEYEVEAVMPPKVFAIAVEKREPFRCGVFEVPMFCWKRNRKGWIVVLPERYVFSKTIVFTNYYSVYREWVVCYLDALLAIDQPDFWFNNIGEVDI